MLGCSFGCWSLVCVKSWICNWVREPTPNLCLGYLTALHIHTIVSNLVATKVFSFPASMANLFFLSLLAILVLALWQHSLSVKSSMECERVSKKIFLQDFIAYEWNLWTYPTIEFLNFRPLVVEVVPDSLSKRDRLHRLLYLLYLARFALGRFNPWQMLNDPFSLDRSLPRLFGTGYSSWQLRRWAIPLSQQTH